MGSYPRFRENTIISEIRVMFHINKYSTVMKKLIDRYSKTDIYLFHQLQQQTNTL